MTDAIKDEWIEAGMRAAVQNGGTAWDVTQAILAAVTPLIRAELEAENERLMFQNVILRGTLQDLSDEYERTHRAIPLEFCLDPPDGGDVKPWEAVQRMADALTASCQREKKLREALDCARIKLARYGEQHGDNAIGGVEAEYNAVIRLIDAALSEKPAAEKEVGAESRDPMEDSQWWDDSDMGAR